jgi:hypothetical protein
MKYLVRWILSLKVNQIKRSDLLSNSRLRNFSVRKVQLVVVVLFFKLRLHFSEWLWNKNFSGDWHIGKPLKDWVWEVSIIISSIRMELCTEEIVSLKDIEIVKMSYIICLNQSGPILSCRRTMNIEQHQVSKTVQSTWGWAHRVTYLQSLPHTW